jgi:hypothetical protein
MTSPSLSYRCHNGKGFVLTAEWSVLIDEGWVSIPAGTVTDLASIPRILWWIPGLAPMDFGVPAPVMHDWAYRRDGQLSDEIHVSRRRADELFRTLARAEGNGRLRCFVAWAMLRLFGWLAFRRLPSREQALRLAE